MSLPKQIATHIRQLYFGGNWTGVNLKEQLADVTWQHATTEVHSLNTIAKLVYHINYYVDACLKVLNRNPLDSHDRYSFDCPPILSQNDWERLLDKMFTDAETLANLVEQLPESKLWETFTDEKYGNYYRNIHGIIEHTYYHLGQVVLEKKLCAEGKK